MVIVTSSAVETMGLGGTLATTAGKTTIAAESRKYSDRREEKPMSNRMKLFLHLIVLACICCVHSNGAQSQTPQTAGSSAVTSSSFNGVWSAQMDGLPAIALVITDEGGSQNGAVLFYFHQRKTGNDPWTSTAGLPEPIFNIHFNGKSLEFQVSHRRAHPPRTLSDPPASFHLTLTDANHAELVNENEGERGPTLVLVRSDY
jgi:hypothetical protein